MPDKLARQIAFMEGTGAALSYTGFWRERMTREGRPGTAARRAVAVPPDVTRDALLRGNVIGCLTACYDRERLGSVPMPSLPLSEDFALWLEILSRIERAHGLREPLAVYRVRAGSVSSGRLRAVAATWAMYRGHLGLSPARSAYCFGSHLARRALASRLPRSRGPAAGGGS